MAVLSRLPNNATDTDTPAPCQSNWMAEQNSVALLFSGFFLALVGITFTAMGWQYYQASPSFEWTQLLGPILISVGGAFISTSVYNLCIISRRPCRQSEEGVVVIPVSDQTSRGHPFGFRGMNQPVVLQGATTVRCAPPAYNFVTQERQQAGEFQPVTGAALPSYEAVCCVDNPAFTAEDHRSAGCTDKDHRQKSMQKTEDQGGSTCLPPPAYKDIYPT
ncbi:transmembrane protein 174 [Parambassis ranga]|uniref:Transmembrane protein 174 n=1 Tax=Parambassis ranga TaxID=210632 RepID=A0A6P7JBS8_9TELE|nr:transmembrane protein 174 [Parambassis ranga]